MLEMKRCSKVLVTGGAVFIDSQLVDTMVVLMFFSIMDVLLVYG